MEQHLNINTCITLHKKSLLFHFFVIFTSPVDLRPDGNHRLNAHLMQLVDHCLRIREVFLVKTVITASWPVIVVDHKNIQRNAAFFVLARHVQNLLLVVVAQLALPEAKAVLRHHRNFTNGICKVLFNFCRGIACGYPVVELLCGACQPFRCENWTTPPQSLIVTGFNGIHVCVLCDPFMTSSFCQVISLLRPHSKPLLQD